MTEQPVCLWCLLTQDREGSKETSGVSFFPLRKKKIKPVSSLARKVDSWVMKIQLEITEVTDVEHQQGSLLRNP